MNFRKSIFLVGVAASMLISCKNSERKSQEEIELEKDQAVTEKTNIRDNSVQEEGMAIYTENCVTCHQANGSGVPRLNPPLSETEYVLGDKEQLIGILLNGSAIGLKVKGQTYSNNMPSFDYLSDQQIADVLTYVRSNFGNDAEAITPSEVEAVRQKQ